MTYNTRAHNAIREAIDTIRSLISEANSAAEYGEIADLANLASTLAGLLPVVNSTTPKTSRSPSETRIKPHTKAKRTRSTIKYPHYERDGERLVKIGWSKKNKSSYEHRAPFSAVRAVAKHLVHHGSSTDVFQIEDVLPIGDPETDSDIPAYQIYLVISWLREIGFAQKKGRDGYVVHQYEWDEELFISRWNSIPVKSN